MDKRIFFWNVMGRVALLTLTMLIFVWMLEYLAEERLFTMISGILLLVLQVILLSRYVLNLSAVVEQFIDSVSREEYPEIRFRTGRVAFRSLRERSNSLRDSLNSQRMEREKQDRIMRQVMNEAEVGLVFLNRKDEVLFMNDMATAIMKGRTVRQLDDIRNIQEKLWQFMNEGDPGPRVIRLELEGEQLFSVRYQAVRVFEEEYKLFSFQNIQQELNQHETDSWQKIIRVLTHEIMNAVGPILSLTSSLQKQMEVREQVDSGRVVEGLKIIRDTGKGLIGFTEEYRKLALLPPPQKEKLDLDRLVGQVLTLMEAEAGGMEVAVSYQPGKGIMQVMADRHQVEMAVLNLLRNAMDALSDCTHGREIAISLEHRDKRVYLAIRDNGPGIAPELIDQVFVPFFTTREKGSGIGLSLVRQIMFNHGGSIHLDSEPGKGAVVLLSFRSFDKLGKA